MNNHLENIDAAITAVEIVWEDSHEPEIADVMAMLSEYRRNYVQDHGQTGVGA